MSAEPVVHTRATDHLDARMWGALLVLCGAVFLDGLDVSTVGVALPSIRRDLGLSTGSLQWIVSGYVLGYGGLLLLGGRAADLLGRRRVFYASLAVFVGASALGGIVSDGSLLIATRFINGVSAAFTPPAGLSIITTTFIEGPARNRALSVYTATAASGWSLGLVLGGLVTQLGWRYTFLLPVPIALAVLVAAPRFLGHDDPSSWRWHGVSDFDVAGALTITAAMLGLVFTIVNAPMVGWGSARTLLSFAGVIALLAGFSAIEQRTPRPLVRLGILRSGSLVRANLFGAPRAGAIVDRVGTTRPIVLAMLCFIAAYVLLHRLVLDSAYVSAILPAMLLVGLGFALSYGPLNIAATAGVADHEQGLASGLVNTSFQLGGAVALAVVTAVIAAVIAVLGLLATVSAAAGSRWRVPWRGRRARNCPGVRGPSCLGEAG